MLDTANNTDDFVSFQSFLKATPAEESGERLPFSGLQRLPGWPHKNGLSCEDKEKIVRLYQAGEKITEIAPIIGCGTSTVHRVVQEAGVSRPYGERKAMFCAANPVGTHGRKATIKSPKSGGYIRVDSTYEAARVLQLEADADVVSIGRCLERVKYFDNGKERFYSPDLTVRYVSGDSVVEEIKPFKFAETKTNIAKFDAARRVLNCRFVVVTEKDIGADWLKAGVSAVDYADCDEVKALRKDKRRAQRRAAQKSYVAKKRTTPEGLEHIRAMGRNGNIRFRQKAKAAA